MSMEIYSKFRATELNEIFALGRNCDRPIGPMKFILSNGLSISAYFIRSTQDSRGNWNLLLRHHDDFGKPGSGITFLPGNSVVAVSVDQLETAAEFFGFGSVDQSDLLPPMASLELKRFIAEKIEKLDLIFQGKILFNTSVQFSLQDSDFMRKSSADFFQALFVSFEQFECDAFSKATILKQIENLEVKQAIEPKIELVGRTLEISANFQKKCGGFEINSLKGDL